MGPFPHTAPRAEITSENPAGTDGFEFVEFAHPNPQELRDLFAHMGYAHVANHKAKIIELWQQGDVTYILNADPDSFAARFVEEHGPKGADRDAGAVHTPARSLEEGRPAAPRDCPSGHLTPTHRRQPHLPLPQPPAAICT